MMNFIPTFYDDELLVSAISRYRMRSGIRSVKSLEYHVFGQKRMTKSAFLPIDIDGLCANLPPNSKITSDELIQNHTLYPFYTAYLSDEKAKQVLEAMKKGSRTNIENMVGITASGIKPSQFLKYCPTCVHDDYNTLGESYWRRLPQLPGVFICPKHKVFYKRSSVIMHDGRLSYVVPNEESLNEEIDNAWFSNKWTRLNLEYVRYAESLLNATPERKPSSFIVNYYVDQLRQKGFASSNGNIYMKEFAEAFMDYFAADYLDIMQSSIDEKDGAGWLGRFFRNNYKHKSPLRHLLIHQFLKLSVHNLFETGSVQGRSSSTHYHEPKFSMEQRKREWLNLIEANPGANRLELKEKAKGLHTWICKHDFAWYDQVTPRQQRRGTRSESIDWQEKDDYYLKLIIQGEKALMNKAGKPERVTPNRVFQEVGLNRHSVRSPKLVKTQEHLTQLTEDLEHYRKRKIKWAINDMKANGLSISVYKVRRHIGFGGEQEVKRLIQKTMNEIMI
ncbi:TnsD family Tn7-like transposition protein [Alkalibacillus salilacus]|uniref:Transposon Tn7 transposition protein TnsD C-termianl domain-containing protein n=1 Tax=Alkalibacillus salilacus TaxID=284582 RepID=A0ABT9VIE4_9BACI|nr:TnsD family Tn7-like transposition protein [Alkalibacillus salilacus]MDQ0160731.1 hypothetical protein [Alkalibacillus salilacus]